MPSIYEEKLNRHEPPNSFVSFHANLENPTETNETKVCHRQISPIWNYQLLIQINSEFFLEDSKYFVLRVLHKFDDQTSTTKGHKTIGHVSIDLQPLICGLSHISGWYNIQDTVGNCQGQLKVSILPQDSLFWLKELHANRKRRSNQQKQTISNEKTSFYGTSKFDSPSQISSISSLETQTESSKDAIDLKNGLMHKLDELDKLNRALKERLEPKLATKIESIKKLQEQEVEKLVANLKVKTNVESNLEFNPVNERRKTPTPTRQLQQQRPVEEWPNNEENEINVKITREQNGTSVLDSFWASSINSEKSSINIHILETVKSTESVEQQKLQIEVGNNFEKITNRNLHESNIESQKHSAISPLICFTYENKIIYL